MTNKLSEKDFTFVRIQCWFNILRSGYYPVLWEESTEEGTNVLCEMFNSDDEAFAKLEELKTHATWANETYGFGISFAHKPDEPPAAEKEENVEFAPKTDIEDAEQTETE